MAGPHASQRGHTPPWRRAWWAPAFAFALGLLILAAHAIGGNARDGLRGLAVMVVVAAIFVAGSRSDTLRGVAGPGRDERWALIDVRATAFAGMVVVVTVVAAWLYEVASGRSGESYVRLGAVAGVAYIAALAWSRRRS